MIIDNTFTILRTTKIAGIEHYEVFKGCKVRYSRGSCECGFYRHAFNRFLNDKQTADLKHHVECNDSHKIAVNHRFDVKEIEPPLK